MLFEGWDNFEMSTFHCSMLLVSTDCYFLFSTGISFLIERRLRSRRGTGGLDFLRLSSVSYPELDRCSL